MISLMGMGHITMNVAKFLKEHGKMERNTEQALKFLLMEKNQREYG